MTISRRNLIRVISFLTAFIIALGAFVFIEKSKVKKLKIDAEYRYSMNLSELNGSLYNISLALRKSLYASSATQFGVIAAELSAESTVAKNALSQLPPSAEEISNVNKFLSQVGDYTLYLSKKVISGQNISDDERTNLHTLAVSAASLSGKVENIKADYEQEGVWDLEFSKDIEESVSGSFSDNLLELEELLSDYPTLIYDGPFSDHMLNGTSLLLDNSQEITLEEAITVASEVLKTDAKNIKRAEDINGKIPSFCFNFGESSVAVTKKGGYVLYMRIYREIAEHKISYEDALELGQEYLQTATETKFEPTYYFSDEGVCVINFAAKVGTTLCYTDLVKVGIALDTGEIVLLESAGYLSNHYDRTIVAPSYSVADATEKLSKSLKVNAVKRAIIPTDGNKEKHCYEFNCTGIDNEELLVYMNVKNLEEEKILLVLKTDGGTLVK